MNHITNLFGERKPEILTKANSERAWLIDQFVEELNKDVGNKFTDKTGKERVVEKTNYNEVNFFLSHLKKQDLYYFLKVCQQASYGFRIAYFAGLKTKQRKTYHYGEERH